MRIGSQLLESVREVSLGREMGDMVNGGLYRTSFRVDESMVKLTVVAEVHFSRHHKH